MATGRVPTTANSPLTTKGDLFTYDTSQARLAVGSNGETLVADSSATTGLRWTATPSASNPVINSAFDIWQRGTSVAGTLGTSNGTYTADRWDSFVNAGANTVSRQVTNDTTNLPNIQYCARMARDSGQTSTNVHYFSQILETTNSIPFAGKTVTLSFYARAGANYSTTSNALTFKLLSGTGTDQNYFVGLTGQANVINTTATLTTTWQRFTASATVATTATQLVISFERTPSGTAGAADYFEVTGVQVDIGSIALPFRRSAATLAGELAACQRYYFRATANVAYSTFGRGHALSTTQTWLGFQPLATMRVVPTSIDYANVAVSDGSSGYTAITALTIGDSNTSHINLAGTVASGLTQNRPYALTANNNSAAYIGVSAEL